MNDMMGEACSMQGINDEI